MSQIHTPFYRPEIDGLRAIAVTSVILYHFGIPGLSGGFVGVDIFFVISGFLIGNILWKELETTGKIAIGTFFLRRIRRLAPAFFAMTAVVSVAAYLVLLPFEFREYGKELIASTVWLSNVHFFREAGYFDIGSENRVLLHTWSLAIEEQFYLLLPLLLLVMCKKPQRITISLLLALWVASLAACVFFTPQYPTATFYLFPFRAWEMLSGVLLAIWSTQSKNTFSHGSLVSWLGLALIVSGIALIESGNHFPGWQATWPVLGATLIILNGKNKNLVNHLLCARIPVFIGLVSYSLYLWHWPVLTISKYWRGGYQSPAEILFWITVACVLAVAAWLLVERPARHHLSNKVILLGFVGLGALNLSIGAGAYLTNGAPARFGPPALTHIEASTSFFMDWSKCAIVEEGPLKDVSVCSVGPSGEPKVLFWGDSHLRAMMGGIDKAALEANTPGIVIWNAGCPPLFGVSKVESAATPSQDQQCLDKNTQLQKAFPDLQHISRIVLIGRWTYYATGQGTGLDAHNTIQLSATPEFEIKGQTQQEVYESAWIRSVDYLSRHFDKVYVFRQSPEMPRYDSRTFALNLLHGRQDEREASASLSTSLEELRLRSAGSERILMELDQKNAIDLIDSWPMLCAPECKIMHDGQSYYFDNNHLNTTGADALKDLWLPALKGM